MGLICPLLQTDKEINDEIVCNECQETNCAWWNNKENSCAILVLSEKDFV